MAVIKAPTAGTQRCSEVPERSMESPKGDSTVDEESVESTVNLEQLKTKHKKQGLWEDVFPKWTH